MTASVEAEPGRFARFLDNLLSAELSTKNGHRRPRRPRPSLLDPARVDYSKAGFSQVKTTAIEQLGMGTNSKLHLQFKTASGTRWETRETPIPTPDTRPPGRSPVRNRGRRGYSSTTPAETSARASVPARPPNAPRNSSASWSPCCPGSRRGGNRKGPATSPASTPRFDFQGYLNGDVESGERATSEILAALKGR